MTKIRLPQKRKNVFFAAVKKVTVRKATGTGTVRNGNGPEFERSGKGTGMVWNGNGQERNGHGKVKNGTGNGAGTKEIQYCN